MKYFSILVAVLHCKVQLAIAIGATAGLVSISGSAFNQQIPAFILLVLLVVSNIAAIVCGIKHILSELRKGRDDA